MSKHVAQHVWLSKDKLEVLADATLLLSRKRCWARQTLKCLKQLCLNCNTYWPLWQSLHLLMLVCETIMHASIGQTRILIKTNNLLLQIIIIKTSFGVLSVQTLIFGSWQQAVTVVNSGFQRILFSSCVNMQRLFQLLNNVAQNISNQGRKIQGMEIFTQALRSNISVWSH